MKCKHALFFPRRILRCAFCEGFCDDNANAAVEEYRRRYPERRIPSRDVFTRDHQTLRDNGCVLSVAVQSEREMLRTMNTRENILVMVQRSPPLSTGRMASRIGVSHTQVWRTLREDDILTTIKGYIWKHATMLNVWNCATG